jgi:2-polyprenylphenol hydroxylase and related flavodoxin oxidoreductases
MKQVIFKVKSNKALSADVSELKLMGDTVGLRAGQFVEIALPSFYLRRPFGVADCDGETLTVLYKVVGLGTETMTSLQPGDALDVLTDLGNGFGAECEKPLLIGGGIGLAPLYLLAKAFCNRGVRPTIIMGFKTANEAFYVKEFSAIADVIVSTEDGTLGEKGNAVEVLKRGNFVYDKYFACGPMAMLKALKEYNADGELSLEARMGCGFGACMGCSIMTVSGAKRVCKEGPIFAAKEVIL